DIYWDFNSNTFVFTGDPGPLNYMIINTIGQILKSGTLKNNTNLTLNLHQGMYFLVINKEMGTNQVFPFIIK
ncbi:MAG: T9SS type A sorting domain-containing protein, partial [Saprospiraceae bacterium]|nr:T9SS type A sorting domain-containing protein [Saprospiraceae bacterium]